MLVLVLGLLITANIGRATELQCITDCTVGKFQFGEPFSFPGAQCQQRILGSDCTVRVIFNYHDRNYNVEFGKNRSSADVIQINSLSYLSYTLNHYCSDRTDCVFSGLQKKIDKMVHHSYNAENTYAQLAPLIENSSRNRALQCYNIENKIVKCSRNQICSVSYNQREQEIRARGCHTNRGAQVYVYDSERYSVLHIDCAHNLCNDEATVTKIKSILAQNGLTDPNGRRLNVGTKEMISVLLLTFTLISAVISYF